MTKKLAILGASYLQLPLVLKVKELGIESICFAWEDGAICREHCNKYYPISITDKERVLKKCIEEKIDGITSIATDVAVPTMSFVASEMGLVGNSVLSGKMSTNKHLMRDAFYKKGIPIPRFVHIRGPEEFHNAEFLNFPLIVKPADRSGSLGITMVEDKKSFDLAVDYALNASFVKEAIIEEFISGQEISVETISWQGQHYILAYTDKVTSGYPHFVELEHHQPSEIINDSNKKYIETLVINALNALDIKVGASHAELIITDNNEVYVTEIGARMGGDFIGSDLVKNSTGFDFLKSVIEVSLGKFDQPIIDSISYSGVYFLSDKTIYIKQYIENCKIYTEIVHAEILNDAPNNLQSSSDRNGFLIYQSNNKFHINEAFDHNSGI